MHKYHHIEQFYQIVRYINSVNKGEDVPEQFHIKSPVSFRGSCKLHGTNAGVTQFDQPSGKGGRILYAQSRTRIITPEDDNHGFAKFVDERSDQINEIIDIIRGKHGIGATSKVTLYGEWIGPGLQSGMAINQLSDKQWVLFGVKVTEIEDREGQNSKYIDAVPMLGDDYQEQNIFSIMDVLVHNIEIDFDSDQSKKDAVELFDHLTALVEACCPWGRRFGIEGMGEGIVWVPTGSHWGNSDLFFKTKGEKHKNVKTKKKTEQLGPELLNSINEFIEFAVTENRLNQGLDSVREMEHSITMKSMGSFLKWVAQDVKRECAAELEENNLDWKQVQKMVTSKSKDFFMKKMKEI